MIRPCDRCGEDSAYWTCCGGASDGSAGTTCMHTDGECVCDACWDAAEDDREVSSASSDEYLAQAARTLWREARETCPQTPYSAALRALRALAEAIAASERGAGVARLDTA